MAKKKRRTLIEAREHLHNSMDEWLSQADPGGDYSDVATWQDLLNFCEMYAYAAQRAANAARAVARTCRTEINSATPVEE